MPWPALCYILLAQAQQDSWRAVRETEHYVVKTTGTAEQAEALGKHMELVYRTYAALLNYQKPATRKFTIRLYKDHDEYAKHGAGGTALAHYNPGTKELVGSADPDGMWAIFAHEGMHQFIDMVMPDFQKGVRSGQVPTWYSEGIADCIGNSEVRDGKMFMCTMSGYIAKMRIIVIQTAVRENKVRPFRELLYLDQRRFYSENGRLNYATGWALTHFLMVYPKTEDPAKQIPGGKYKSKLVQFHNLLASGKKRDEAYAIAFGIARPSDWDVIDKQWREYVLSFPDPLAGTPLAGLAADIGNLDKTDGVYVGAIAEDAACFKAGLRPGDVILAVDGREVRHYGQLIPPLERKKAGETAAISVKRGGETVEIKVEWAGK
ncbi:MAG: PDZ domain-containing protein [Planctomycetes bacterium]|nr:PDZ domain-containing protein [Planctomycetota bacterium]